MKKTLIRFLSLLILGALPFGVMFSLTSVITPRYEQTFLGELPEKIARLDNAEGKKIVFVGGSSLPFGIKSELIESELSSYRSVNFGLYADLGTKAMIDLSKKSIREGDIVVLAPELSAQTYSLYFNPTSTLTALEGNFSARKRLPFSDRLKVFYNSFSFNITRIKDRKKAPIEVSAPYSRASFDAYGEIITERKANLMPNGYISKIDVGSLYNDEFFDYVKNYKKYVESKGARFFFSFCPINDKAVEKTALTELYTTLKSKLECEFLGIPTDFYYGSEYFYDTDFHLNDAGAVLHSVNLIDLLKAKLGISTPTHIEIPKPGHSAGTPEYEDGDDSFADCFEYERKKAFSADGNDAYTYTVVGVKPEAAELESLIIPSYFESFPVTEVSSGALSALTRLKSLYVPKNCSFIDGGAFDGCLSLEKIYILSDSPQSLFVPFDGTLTRGCPENLKIVVPHGKSSLFMSDYTWKIYSSAIVEE